MSASNGFQQTNPHTLTAGNTQGPARIPDLLSWSVVNADGEYVLPEADGKTYIMGMKNGRRGWETYTSPTPLKHWRGREVTFEDGSRGHLHLGRIASQYAKFRARRDRGCNSDYPLGPSPPKPGGSNGSASDSSTAAQGECAASAPPNVNQH